MTERYGYDKTPTPPRDYDASKVPSEIKKRANWVKTKFTGEDVAEAYGQAMEITGIYSDEAKKIAQQNKVRQDALEVQTANNVAQMEADKNTIVANATVDSEVILARGGKATLGQRLDETTAQLAQTGINVTSLGAEMDGLTDDSDILIMAHEKLPDSGGKIIIPSGKLKITKKITFTKTIILEGVSSHHQLNHSGSVILTEGDGELVFTGASSGIRDLMVDGVTGNTSNGITLLCSRGWIDNVSASRHGGNGVQVGSINERVNANSWYINNLKTRFNKKDGLSILSSDESPNANAGTLIKLDSGANEGNGLTVVNSIDDTFLGVHIESNIGYGVELINSSGHSFFKPYLEANKKGEFYSDATSIRNYIIGNREHQRVNEITFDNPSNYIMARGTKGVFPYINQQTVDDLLISNEDVPSGHWKFKQTSLNELLLELGGTSNEGTFNMKSALKINDGNPIFGYLKKYLTVGHGTLAPGASVERKVSLPGVLTTSAITVNSRDNSLTTGIVMDIRADADDSVTIRFSNITSSSISNAEVSVVISVFV